MGTLSEVSHWANAPPVTRCGHCLRVLYLARYCEQAALGFTMYESRTSELGVEARAPGKLLQKTYSCKIWGYCSVPAEITRKRWHLPKPLPRIRNESFDEFFSAQNWSTERAQEMSMCAKYAKYLNYAKYVFVSFICIWINMPKLEYAIKNMHETCKHMQK